MAVRAGLKRCHDHPGRTMDMGGTHFLVPRVRPRGQQGGRSAFADRFTRDEHRQMAADEQRAAADDVGRGFVDETINPVSRNCNTQVGQSGGGGAQCLITRNNFAGPSNWTDRLPVFSTEPLARDNLSALQREQANREIINDTVSTRKRKATHILDPYGCTDRAVEYTEARPFKRTMRGDASAMRDEPVLPPQSAHAVPVDAHSHPQSAASFAGAGGSAALRQLILRGQTLRNRPAAVHTELRPLPFGGGGSGGSGGGPTDRQNPTPSSVLSLRQRILGAVHTGDHGGPIAPDQRTAITLAGHRPPPPSASASRIAGRTGDSVPAAVIRGSVAADGRARPPHLAAATDGTVLTAPTVRPLGDGTGIGARNIHPPHRSTTVAANPGDDNLFTALAPRGTGGGRTFTNQSSPLTMTAAPTVPAVPLPTLSRAPPTAAAAAGFARGGGPTAATALASAPTLPNPQPWSRTAAATGQHAAVTSNLAVYGGHQTPVDNGGARARPSDPSQNCLVTRTPYTAAGAGAGANLFHVPVRHPSASTYQHGGGGGAVHAVLSTVPTGRSPGGDGGVLPPSSRVRNAAAEAVGAVAFPSHPVPADTDRRHPLPRGGGASTVGTAATAAALVNNVETRAYAGGGGRGTVPPVVALPGSSHCPLPSAVGSADAPRAAIVPPSSARRRLISDTHQSADAAVAQTYGGGHPPRSDRTVGHTVHDTFPSSTSGTAVASSAAPPPPTDRCPTTGLHRHPPRLASDRPTAATAAASEARWSGDRGGGNPRRPEMRPSTAPVGTTSTVATDGCAVPGRASNPAPRRNTDLLPTRPCDTAVGTDSTQRPLITGNAQQRRTGGLATQNAVAASATTMCEGGEHHHPHLPPTVPNLRQASALRGKRTAATAAATGGPLSSGTLRTAALGAAEVHHRTNIAPSQHAVPTMPPGGETSRTRATAGTTPMAVQSSPLAAGSVPHTATAAAAITGARPTMTTTTTTPPLSAATVAQSPTPHTNAARTATTIGHRFTTPITAVGEASAPVGTLRSGTASGTRRQGPGAVIGGLGVVSDGTVPALARAAAAAATGGNGPPLLSGAGRPVANASVQSLQATVATPVRGAGFAPARATNTNTGAAAAAVAVPSVADGFDVGTAARSAAPAAAAAAVESGRRTLAGSSGTAGADRMLTTMAGGGAAVNALLSTAVLGSFLSGGGGGGVAALAIAHPNVDAPRTLPDGRCGAPSVARAWAVSVSGAAASTELPGSRGEQREAMQTRATDRPREGWDRSAPLTHARPGMRDWRNIGSVFQR
jgi:hypothetical protein